jgi:hypothetical protein
MLKSRLFLSVLAFLLTFSSVATYAASNVPITTAPAKTSWLENFVARKVQKKVEKIKAKIEKIQDGKRVQADLGSIGKFGAILAIVGLVLLLINVGQAVGAILLIIGLIALLADLFDIV